MNLARTGDLVLGRVAAALQPFDVSPAGGLVLGILKDAGEPCPPNYISDRLIVSRATVTGVLDTLVKRGLVRREPHPTDRGGGLVHLTKTGSRMGRRGRRTVRGAEGGGVGALRGAGKTPLTGVPGKVQR